MYGCVSAREERQPAHAPSIVRLVSGLSRSLHVAARRRLDGLDRARLLANVQGALADGAYFFVSTMCGDITQPALRDCFDPATRCQVVDGVAYRYIGDATEILDELRTAGFEIVRSTVCTRTDDNDQDNLWAIARKS